MSSKKEQELTEVLIILNATMKSGWPPLGNQGLMDKIKEYDVYFNKVKSKWEAMQPLWRKVLPGEFLVAKQG